MCSSTNSSEKVAQKINSSEKVAQIIKLIQRLKLLHQFITKTNLGSPCESQKNIVSIFRLLKPLQISKCSLDLFLDLSKYCLSLL